MITVVVPSTRIIALFGGEPADTKQHRNDYTNVRSFTVQGLRVNGETGESWSTLHPSVNTAVKQRRAICVEFIHRVSKFVYMVPLNLGSKASRRPSPIILKLNTTNIIAIPGAIERRGFVNKYDWPSLTMVPQAAFGGCMPTPK